MVLYGLVTSHNVLTKHNKVANMEMRIAIFLLVFIVSHSCWHATAGDASGVSLSINIPTLKLNDLLSGSSHKTGVTEARENIKPNHEATPGDHEEKDEKEEKSDGSSGGGKTTSLDLGKLLASGKPVSIKSTETSTMGESGMKEKDVKEVSISTLGAQGNDEGASNHPNEQQLDGKSVEKLVSALKQGLFNNSNPKDEHLKADENLTTGLFNNSVPKVEHLRADENPSSGLSEDLKAPKDSKAVKNKDKDKVKGVAEESTTANPDQTDSSSESVAPKQNPLSGGNQIALVPVSVPAALLSQLQNAMNGSTSPNAESFSASSPSLASLLSLQGANTNTNSTPHHTEEANSMPHHTDQTNSTLQHNDLTNSTSHQNALAKEGALNKTAGLANNSTNDAADEDNASINHGKDEGKDVSSQHKLVSKNSDQKQEEHKDDNSGHKSEPKNNTANFKLIGGGKDAPLLVVIPQVQSASTRRNKMGRKERNKKGRRKSGCLKRKHRY